MTRYIGYARVSTDKQGRSGLGMEAQEATIRQHVKATDSLLMPIMVEVESGKRDDRPVLAEALARCRLMGATLLVAKLDRLARNRAFVGTIMAGGVPVEFCDLPASKGATGTFLLGIMAEVAQLEAGLISERTKAALGAIKARGTVLGGYRGVCRDGSPAPKVDGSLGNAAKGLAADSFAARVIPTIRELQATCGSLDAIAKALTVRGIVTARGGSWSAMAVSRILGRAG